MRPSLELVSYARVMLNDRAVVIFGFIMPRDLVINEWLINFLHRIQFGEWFHAEPFPKNKERRLLWVLKPICTASSI